jgi:hypothetical protein
MAIKSDYKHLKDAYIRVGRIWGSKSEGWNCWVEVFEKESSQVLAIPHFMVSAPYIEGRDPFVALYAAIESHIKETDSEVPIKPFDEDETPIPKVKSRKKSK